jgi:hypothetical protein
LVTLAISFVDGYDAAALIQALKARLEHPATLFIT